jgi:hypothetical protein
MNVPIPWLLRLLDEAFDGPAWHGPTLSSVVRGFSAEQAAWRPAPGRHSAWEIVLHCAYWKHRVHARVAPGTAAPFLRTGSNWPDAPEEISTARWRADVALLKSAHAGLREAVAALPPASLQRPAPGQKKTRLANIVGICYHDIYHAGQIRLLHRIQESETADRARRERRESTRSHPSSTRRTGTQHRRAIARATGASSGTLGGEP